MIPDDDPSRSLTVANPDDPATTYISLVGNTYAISVLVGTATCRS